MRIASLSPATTEILFALGAGSQIACTDQYSDFPEAATALPHLRGHVKIDHVELKSYQPDLVLTQTLVQEKLAEELREAGFTVIYHDPRSIVDVEEGIVALGAIVDAQQQAQALTLRMRQGFNAVKKKSALLLRKPRVYVEEWHHPPMVSGNWVPEVVRIAGGQPFPLDPRAASREVNLREVQQFDPDLIVLSICGAGAMAQKTLLTVRPGWGSLRAVGEGHLFVIDDSLLNRPGPRLVEGAQRLYSWIFQVLH